MTAPTSATSTSSASIKGYAQRFLLFDYRLNVIKRMLVYVLITTRSVVQANVFSESTAARMSASSEIQNTTTRQTLLNSLLNRTSSAIFMSDDIAAEAVGAVVVGDGGAVDAGCGALQASNFGCETKHDTNQNAKEFEKRNKRNTRDDLFATTTTTTENLKASTPTKQQTATMVQLSTALKDTNATAATTAEAAVSTKNTTPTTQRILSRPKRFLTFPEGSSFSVAVCFTVGIIGNPRFNYMAFGLNWGVAYDLPNTTWVINHLHGYTRQPVPVTVLRRRTRRALYKEIEMVVDNMGYNGRDCVLRALCESRQYFCKNKLSMIGEMMRVIFSLPKQRIFTRELHENSEIEVYDRAYRRARDVSCEHQYDCTFSLLELAFGKYSTPPEGYY